MRIYTKVMCVAVIMGTGGMSASSSLARGDAPPAQRILEELDGIQIPLYNTSKKGDSEYVHQFTALLRRTTRTRAELIWKLYLVAPNHDRIPALMAERWCVRPFALPEDQVLQEVGAVLARTQNPKLKLEAVYAESYIRLYRAGNDHPLDLSGVEKYLTLAPQDPRGAILLQLAANRTTDQNIKSGLNDRILREFPDSSCAKVIEGVRNQADRIGKPFTLEFTDAIGGSKISIEKLKGKVVVIDFWATWCGPCVAAMPEIKELYSRYRDRGVAFIGVSLDVPKEQGGLASLKKFVHEKEIAWPQYYQGNGWESEFSASCGITAIPAVFVVDSEGKLVSTDASARLEALITGLIK